MRSHRLRARSHRMTVPFRRQSQIQVVTCASYWPAVNQRLPWPLLSLHYLAGVPHRTLGSTFTGGWRSTWGSGAEGSAAGASVLMEPRCTPPRHVYRSGGSSGVLVQEFVRSFNLQLQPPPGGQRVGLQVPSLWSRSFWWPLPILILFRTPTLTRLFSVNSGVLKRGLPMNDAGYSYHSGKNKGCRRSVPGTGHGGPRTNIFFLMPNYWINIKLECDMK